MHLHEQKYNQKVLTITEDLIVIMENMNRCIVYSHFIF